MLDSSRSLRAIGLVQNELTWKDTLKLALALAADAGSNVQLLSSGQRTTASEQ